MRVWAAALMTCLGLSGPLLADAPTRSLVPVPRPGTGVAPETAADPVVTPFGPVVVIIRATELAPNASIRPVYRPGIGRQVTPARPVEPVVVELPPVVAPPIEEPVNEPPRGLLALLTGQNRHNQPGVTAVSRSLRPGQRPEGLAERVRAAAVRATPSRVAQTGTRGALCGDRGIVGERLAAIPGRITGCGIPNPVRVREIDGITLSQPATINCDTAQTLQGWLRNAAVPEVGQRGGGVASIRVIASYACRTRNSQPGARISEHATGNAIDIAAIGLVDGSEISVLQDWGDGRDGRILRNLHEAACGPFGTVLGPNANRLHRDHFHFDVASYRSGAYCR